MTRQDCHGRADRQPDPPRRQPAPDADRPRLNKIRRTSTLEDTPAVRGMIAKVTHLVRVVDRQ